MKDKIIILQSPLADYSASHWGVIKFIDGDPVLDKVKAFNRSRRFLNVGANCFRILRHADWDVQPGQGLDWKDPRYFPILREYLKILHNPCQGTPTGQGARVVIEPFDGCSEKWMYNKGYYYEEARQLLRAFFFQTADLDFVDIGAGNEMNKPEKESTALFRDVIIPEFDKVGKIPFSYGPSYSFKDGPDLIVGHKQEASKKWGDATSFAIYKQVHGIKDKNTDSLKQSVEWWVNHPMSTFWSVDGVKDGANPCDFYQDQVRPSVAQWLSAVKYVLDYCRRGFTLKTGQPKFAFEFISKVWNDDMCGTFPIIAVSKLYKAKFGVYPFNWGKYPNDWVEPPPPGPEPEPEPPIPPTPPVQIKPCCYFWNRRNYLHWLRCVLFGKH